MARINKKVKKTRSTTARVSKSTGNNGSFFSRIQSDMENRQSLISLVLGVLILLVVGVLLFNYFNKGKGELGPSQQATNITTPSIEPDVKKQDLPGKYTVKKGDTLYLIAQRYYENGFIYPELASYNKISDPNTLEVGTVLEVPKVETLSKAPPTTNSPNTIVLTSDQANLNTQSLATGGATNQTIWGETIVGDTYTVLKGDWLSTIAGRAYGDIYAYDRIAKANSIPDPNNIEPGIVLKIPR